MIVQYFVHKALLLVFQYLLLVLLTAINSLSSPHLLHFYTTVIRPVLEYASPLWHPTLTKSQIERLEAVQRRTIKIIFCYSSSTSCLTTLELAGILSLQTRRVDSSGVFQKHLSTWQLFTSSSPTPARPSRDIPSQEAYCISKTKSPNKRYCSAVSYALLYFQ